MTTETLVTNLRYIGKFKVYCCSMCNTYYYSRKEWRKHLKEEHNK